MMHHVDEDGLSEEGKQAVDNFMQVLKRTYNSTLQDDEGGNLE